MKLAQAVIPAVAAVLAVGMSTSPASADPTQPANLGNVPNVERGNSAPGPHCHYVTPGGGMSGFENIVTGAAHQGHINTTGIFTAVIPCP
jgi:hypothetical protein